jgi:hypothetical protein
MRPDRMVWRPASQLLDSGGTATHHHLRPQRPSERLRQVNETRIGSASASAGRTLRVPTSGASGSAWRPTDALAWSASVSHAEVW